MHWINTTDTLEDKLSRIQDAILLYAGTEITLVGESAGGPMALVAFKRLLNGSGKVVTICGMNRGAESVNPKIYEKNTAFKSTMLESDNLILGLMPQEKQRMRTIFSSKDGIISPQNSLIPGVHSNDLDTKGHLRSIMYVLLYKHRMITEEL